MLKKIHLGFFALLLGMSPLVQAATPDCTTNTPIPAAQCDALVALYNSTNGANWANAANKWHATALVCADNAVSNWYGVTCAVDGSGVTELSLPKNLLSGPIPIDLKELAKLTKLDLSDNGLTGSIPSDLKDLVELAELNLSKNLLTGSIPSALATTLTTLDLSDNELSGTIPTDLNTLVNLDVLNLSNNKLIGSIPITLKSKTIDLSLNRLTGTIPSDLDATLEVLNLSDNLLTGSIPDLNGFTVLKTLLLNDNSLCGKVDDANLNTAVITELKLNNNYLTADDATLRQWLDTKNPGWEGETTCPPGKLQFALAEYSVGESDGTIDITVSRVDGNKGAVSVIYLSDDDTATGGDYETAADTLEWADGVSDDQTFAVTITPDTINEGDETFKIELQNATGNAIIGDPATTIVTIVDDDGPGELQFASATYSVNEADGTVTAKVSRVGGENGPISVKCSSSNGTATEPNDYTKVDVKLSWDASKTDDKDCTVAIINDSISEGNETFGLTLSAPTGGATIGDPNTAVVTITDDETSDVLEFDSATYEVNEGSGSVDIEVKRTSTTDDGVVFVRYISSNGSAMAVEDYTAVESTLIWADGDVDNKKITVPIINDVNFEGDETFSLMLKGVGGNAIIGSQGTTTVTIKDNDTSGGNLQFYKATYSVPEGDGPDPTTIDITVKRVGGNEGAVSVMYLSYNNTAKAGEDYETVIGTLEWSDGNNDDKTVTVTIIGDSIDEADEIFKLNLINPTGDATIGSPSETEVTINNDDGPGKLQFASATYNVNEADGTVTAKVNRVGGNNQGAISVKCTSSGDTATESSDYTKVDVKLSWADGDAADKDCTVQIKNDGDAESNETFKLTLSGPTGGATLGEPKETVVTIADDDTLDTLQFSSATYSVDENGSGTVELTVTRVGGSTGGAYVTYKSEDDTAKAEEDYTAVEGTLTWTEAGDNTFTVPIINDAEKEEDETFNVVLSGATGANLGTPNTAVVTIVANDDEPQTGTLQFSKATYSVDENGSGTVELTVTRVGGSIGAASVSYKSSNDTATAGDDYEAVDSQLNWTDGNNASKTITVTIKNDTEYEDNETFNVVLSGATGATLGTPDTAVVTIVDDEEPQMGTLQFSEATYSVNENDGTVELMVTRVDGSFGTASVQYFTEDVTTTAGLDYNSIAGILNWADGDDASKPITVTINNDTETEIDETFNVKLSIATGATLGTQDTAEVTIDDDDGGPQAGTLLFSKTTYSVDENGGTVELMVTRVGGSSGSVSVSYKSSNDTATAGEDYDAVDSQLNWGDGDNATKTITVNITNDTQLEDDETFSVTLSNATNGAAIGLDTTIVTIVDDEKPQRGTLQFSEATYSVNENGGTVELMVTRVGGSFGAASVHYLSKDVTTTAWLDYKPVMDILNWNDGDDTAQPITVTIIDEPDFEEDELFSVKLSLATGATLGTPDTAVVTIANDDPEPKAGILQFDSAKYSIGEDKGSRTIKVTRIGGDDGDVSVDYETSDDTAEADVDYKTTNGTLDWTDGDNDPKSFQVTIIDDSDFEDPDETFIVSLGNVKDAELGTPNTAVVTIIDDDTDTTDCSTVSISQKQCEALVALYEGTGGEDWTENEGWNKTQEPCDWHGVTCDDREKKVLELDLSDNELTGAIPKAFFKLKKLTVLDLSSNNLEGTDFAQFKLLKKLTVLDLSSNNLEGTDLAQFKSLKKLKTLLLNDCLLYGDIPKIWLKKLKKLKKLNIKDNCLNTQVTQPLKDWLDDLNPGWDKNQTNCFH